MDDGWNKAGDALAEDIEQDMTPLRGRIEYHIEESSFPALQFPYADPAPEVQVLDIRKTGAEWQFIYALIYKD